MVKISELLSDPNFHYLQLIAGQAGIHRNFSGINVIESADLVSFCHPNELIVTTGIQLNHDEEQLKKLIISLYSKKIAGFIINIGPYIPRVPSSIIRFADEKQLPLFQFEWKYRIADLLKMTFELISKRQNKDYQQNNEKGILQQLLFGANCPYEEMNELLKQKGISEDYSFCVITCLLENPEDRLSQYRKLIDYEFQKYFPHFFCLEHNNQFIYIVFFRDGYFKHISIKSIFRNLYEKSRLGTKQLAIGMGNPYSSFHQAKKSYNESLTVIRLTQLQEKSSFFQYKDIGAYSIILALYDNPIIKSFHQEMLGPLYVYDQMNGTDYVQFLRIFLEENGSVNRISKKLFLHRNTVNYKIRKLESLLGIDLNDHFAKTNLSIALMIENVLKQNISD